MPGRNKSNHRARHRRYCRSSNPYPSLALAHGRAPLHRKWQRLTHSLFTCTLLNSGKRRGWTRWQFGPTPGSHGALSREDQDISSIAHVRYWHKADTRKTAADLGLKRTSRHVRFTPKNRHPSAQLNARQAPKAAHWVTLLLISQQLKSPKPRLDC